MKAVIMAGGEGKRLRPLTCDRPKPMVYVANRPIMEHITNLLKKHNILDIAVTLQYMPESIRSYFESGEKFGVKFDYYIEEDALGTAGSVKNAQDFLDETFIVISGDVLTDIDITKALEFHKKKGSIATMVLKSVEIPLEYGVVVTNDDGRIKKFLEKPNWREVFSDTVNTGIYILEPAILDYIDKNSFLDFGKDIFPKLLLENVPLYGYITNDYWCDIGDLTSYRNAHKDILDKKVHIDILGKEIAPDVWVGKNVEINENSTIKSPCIIGNNVKINSGVTIDKYTVLGDYNFIGKHSTIKQSIIWNSTILGSNVSLRGCVLSNNIRLNNNVCVYEGSVIGNSCEILEYAIIKPDVKVWPNKKIDSCSVLNEHLIWGTKYTKNIFGSRGINLKPIPEHITKIGLALGSLLKNGGKIGVASSNKYISKLLKMAFSSGVISAGTEVFDFGEILKPMLRKALRFYKLDGGVYIKEIDKDTINIEIFNEDGCNIGTTLERKIENIYNQEEFLRCDSDMVKPIVTVNDYSMFYVMDIINNIKIDDLNLNIAVNTNSDMVRSVLSNILNYMKCKVRFIDIKDFDSYEENVFSSFVRVGNFDLGFLIDDTGENFWLIDKKGRVIDKDKYQILVILIQLINGSKTVVVPMTVSSVVDEIAKKYGGEIKRSKSSISELMKEMYKKDQPELMNQFDMYFDAIFGAISILKFMKQNNYTLESLYDMIPKFYMNKIELKCKKTDKGRVIKELIKENKSSNIETKEGVKIYTKEGWVLVLPDIEKSSIGIISEGFNSEIAKELGIIFENKIKNIIKTTNIF